MLLLSVAVPAFSTARPYADTASVGLPQNWEKEGPYGFEMGKPFDDYEVRSALVILTAHPALWRTPITHC